MSIDTSVGRVDGVRVSIDTSVQVSGQGSSVSIQGARDPPSTSGRRATSCSWYMARYKPEAYREKIHRINEKRRLTSGPQASRSARAAQSHAGSSSATEVDE